MTKRLFLSLAIIFLAIAGVSGAAVAYFTDGIVLGDANNPNIFSTGTVDIDRFNVTNLQVTGLTPGVPVKVSNIGVKYIGTIAADLYVGARGELGPNDPAFIANVTNLQIYVAGTSSNPVFNGYVSDLSTVWQNLKKDAVYGWYYYDLVFTLDPDTGNNKQNVTNSDTEIMIYAVQSNGAIPSGMPFTMPDVGWFNL